MNLDRHEALFSAHYGRRFATVESRLWERLANLFTFIEVFGGTVAVSAWLKESPNLAAFSAVILAAITALNLLIAPKEKSIRQDVMKQRFGEIIIDAPKLKDEELFERVLALQNEPGSEIEALRDPIYNQTAIQLGLDYKAPPLTKWQKLIFALA